MKIFDLKPTDENLLTTYLNDCIGRNKDIFRFVNILNSMEGSCSIALEGKWGSGKTFFVKQTKLVLEANNDFINVILPENKQKIKEKQYSYFRSDETLTPQVCVYYDAWENDSDEDPMLSLVYSIMQVVSSDYTFRERNYIKAGTAILEELGIKSWTKIIENLKGNNPLEELKKGKSLSAKINEFLNLLLLEHGNRLVIFIDELDRCSPAYAVRLLERIKHYFPNENLTFVFSVNIEELQHTIKKYYGDDFDGARYLDRFFDLRVQLPKIDLSNFYSQLQFSKEESTWSIMCDAMIRTYGLELREISRYLQLYKLAVGNYLDKVERERKHFVEPNRYYSLMYVTPIMIALKLVKPKTYYDFIEGRDASPLISASKYLLEGFFYDLLEYNESYESVQSRPEIKVVSMREKLEEMYAALFLTDYSIASSSKNIGKTRFGKDTQELVMNVASLLSQYAQFDD